MNELDELMDMDPLLMLKDHIDSIIAYQRKRRADIEAGIKPKREKPVGQKLDLTALGLIKPKPQVTIKRRI